MKLTKEKELLIGLIVSDEFARKVVPELQTQYLQATSSRAIAKWCIDYYTAYKKAPTKHIQDIFDANKENIAEEDAITIAKVLAHVSKMYSNLETYNVSYMVDRARLYIKERRLAMLVEQLDHNLTTGNIAKAEATLASFSQISHDTMQATNIYEDREIIAEIFSKESHELFRFPGVIGEYMGNFRRSNVYAYAGVAKRGKSRWLAQTASIASLNGYNTVYISLEMDRPETTELLLNTMVRKPVRNEFERVQIKLPWFSEENDILYEEQTVDSATMHDFLKCQSRMQIGGAPIHLIIGEPDNMTLSDIEDKLIALEYDEGFVADVIVLDYANLIKAKGSDNRDKVNTIWMGLKRISKHYHCALITATHMNTEALKKDGEGFNVGEDRRILNHVAGLYILNQTAEEKQAGIMRVKATATRFSRYGEKDEVICLYDYDTGRTLIDSRWKADVPEYNT